MKSLTNKQNIELIKKYREALAAEDMGAARRIAETIVLGNEGLAVKFARRWAKPKTKADEEDAEQAARMAVAKALESFDPEKGSFSTHLSPKVRDYCQRFMGAPGAVKFPKATRMPAPIAKLAARFRLEHGREPTAQDLGISEAKFSEWSASVHYVEIDDQSDDRPRCELTYDEREEENAERCAQLESAWAAEVDKLSPRNQEIAKRVLFEGETAESVAKSLGITQGRVSQVCKRTELRLKRALNPKAFDADEYYRRSRSVRSSASGVVA